MRFLDLPVNPVQAFKKAVVLNGYTPRAQRGNHDLESSQAQVSEAEQSEETLEEITEQSNQVLFRADTVFPFILFPDTIILDRMQLSIIHRPFFMTAKITSIRIEDILSSEVQVGPLFGSIRVVSRYFSHEFAEEESNAPPSQRVPSSIHYLWKRDALEVHKLIQGYIVATQRKIKLSHKNKKELIKLLHELGQNEATRE